MFCPFVLALGGVVLSFTVCIRNPMLMNGMGPPGQGQSFFESSAAG